MQTITSEPGTDYLHNAFRRAADQATASGRPVRVIRCDTECFVQPGDTPAQAKERYLAALRAGNHAQP